MSGTDRRRADGAAPDPARRRCLAGLVSATGLGLVSEPVAARTSGASSDLLDRLDAPDTETTDALVIELNPQVRLPSVVTVRLRAELEALRVLHVLVDHHPTSLIATLHPASGIKPVFSLQLNLEVPCRIQALAETGRGWFKQTAPAIQFVEGCSA